MINQSYNIINLNILNSYGIIHRNGFYTCFVVDVEDDPFEGERDVQVRTDVWVTAEYEILPEILGR